MGQPIPLVVLGGYLGAGKTTIVNALLGAPHGLRVTVLVNDFGAVNVDAALIRHASSDVIGLENGCVCCSIGGKLMETLVEISRRPERPDLLVVEASGVSDPVRIAQVGLLDPAFMLQGILVAVDAVNAQRGLDDPYVGEMVRRQLAGATAVVLTKTDCVSHDAAADVRRLIRRYAHTDILVDADRGRLPAAFFLTPHPPPYGTSVPSAATRPWTTRDVALPSGLTSWTYRSPLRLERRAVKAACVRFSARILRAKGMIRFPGDVDAEIHIVGNRWKVAPYQGPALRETLLVFIGLLDIHEQQELARLLDAAALP